ncbi:hypothetical protein BZA05DRAFT_412545 [Tricharina praecox]|uniref:uncharacterized protein n=1 Tax=Tricharina praecox TaxID=43433 RepID=UPI00221F224D|nr:uncharacterized protein BZA05DRAFT_413880 [Tricharina praecox]XP_051334975.1 uncharacterized protein BZA05DRAFT_412545 [Tricharina praecox]KAI5840646.1 hypothetical protein BZA05DRAFT_413880 [Tricharina praecox]KAI5842074.1 hypothetical protein BZA05DRAFT_412545 [Tricharina praecox]
MVEASATDWMSAVFSGVAAIAAIITLLTVYHAAISIISRREAYRLGISREALGPWEKAVVRPSLWKMQTQISTPTINLAKLGALKPEDWQPRITFPMRFDPKPEKTPSWRTRITSPMGAAKDPHCDLEKAADLGLVLAEASWVNFLEALSIADDNKKCYEMQTQSDMVNGIVPMRWKGRYLAGISSMLGFQVPPKNQEEPDMPMTLPSQWSGPLGWLQFRASADGCVIEFRRRRVRKDHLAKETHTYYAKLDARPLCLQSRLWQSMSGFSLPDDELLYISGADPREHDPAEEQRSTDDICNQVMADSRDLTEEEIMDMLWGKNSQRPRALQPDVVQMGPSQAGDLKEQEKKKSLQLAVLVPCPGLLSVVTEGELADCRGIDLRSRNCYEYRRKYTDIADYNYTKSENPHRLGQLCMSDEVLKLVKKAVQRLEPDSYYFTPSAILKNSVMNIWKHVDDYSDRLDPKIFPTSGLQAWESDSSPPEAGLGQLYHAMTV